MFPRPLLATLTLSLALPLPAQALTAPLPASLDCDALARSAPRDRVHSHAYSMPQMLRSISVTSSKLASPPPPAPAAPPVAHATVEAALPLPPTPVNRENYAHYQDNPIKRASDTPLSTFAIDVDTGSYSNVRRMLNANTRPPADAVRSEEFINYFDYRYRAARSLNEPLRIDSTLAQSPWNAQRQLLRVSLASYVPARMPAANLVFLIDTSGSMDSPDKLPRVKKAICQMLPQLRHEDRISIVTYAGSAGLVLPPTPGNQSRAIYDALANLQPAGSTHGSAGIELAYAQARKSFIADGVNRILLATDGDFNVGVVNQNALETLVADQRRHGVALSVLGVGQGNYNDHLAERLANVGDGNYSYLDSDREARRVLGQNLRATLMTVARDVKIQIEFNPAVVAEYRLIGYENRLLRDEDFDNERVDAGEVGAGHQVTALYEISRVGESGTQLPALRYRTAPAARAATGGELAHIKLRYTLPGQTQSHLLEIPVANRIERHPDPAFRLAAAAAAFADALRGGERIGMRFADIRRLIATPGSDPETESDVAELRTLIEKAEHLVEHR